MSVKLYDTPEIQSQWLSIATHQLHGKLSPLLHEINHQFTKINPIPGWALQDTDKSHITLYMGWNSSPEFNPELQRDLLNKIGKKVTNIGSFNLTITPQNSTLKISKYYVLLSLNDPTLNSLQKKIQKVAQKFIINHNLPQNQGWFDRDYNLHLSLGIIDSASRTGDNRLTGKFKGTWRDGLLNKYLNQRIMQRVDSIDLLGTTSEKVYYTLGQVSLEKNEPEEELFTFRPKDLMRKLQKMSHFGRILDLHIENTINTATNKPETFINVVFDNKKDAQAILTKANLGNKIFEKNGTYMIRLGTNRMNNLFPEEGAQLFKDIVQRLS